MSITGRLDVPKLFSALRDVSDWYQLGIILGILPARLRKIEENYRGNDRRKTETLDTWLQQTPNASWSDVVSALQQMGENTVAESVQHQYIGAVASELVYTFSVLNAIKSLHFIAEDMGMCVCSKRSQEYFTLNILAKNGNLFIVEDGCTFWTWY